MHFYTEQALWILSTVTYIEIVFEEIFILLVLTGEIVAANKNLKLSFNILKNVYFVYTEKYSREEQKVCVNLVTQKDSFILSHTERMISWHCSCWVIVHLWWSTLWDVKKFYQNFYYSVLQYDLKQ